MALEFALDAVAGTVAAAVVLVALDAWLRLGLTARRVLLGIGLVGLAVALLIRFVPRFRAATLDDLSLAMTLDRFRPGTGQQVADVLQLPGLLGEPRSGRVTGPCAAGRPTGERGAGRRPSRHALEPGPDGGTGTGLLGSLLVPVAFTMIAPEAARLSLARWLRGSTSVAAEDYLTVTGLGDRNRLLAPRDEPFTIWRSGPTCPIVGPERWLDRAGPGRAVRDPKAARASRDPPVRPSP